MKTSTLFNLDPEDHSFGSPFDPVLSGVAQGLARLFPPVESILSSEHDEGAARQSEADTESADE